MFNCITSDVQLENSDLSSLLLQLQQSMLAGEFLLPVRRGHVLEDALRGMQWNCFSPKLHLNVQIQIN